MIEALKILAPYIVGVAVVWIIFVAIVSIDR
jgi:hypothetical protein